MANALYGKAREGFATKKIDWVADDIRALLVDASAYAIDIDADEFLAAIPAGARIAASGALAGKAAPLGVCDANDPTIAAVAGATVELIVLYLHTGNDATARLIAAIDTMTGLPFAPNGGDVILQWPNDANRIFKL